jgi:hypothetical protein
VQTAKGNVIEMNDPEDTITLQNAGESDGKKINKAVLNGKDKTITLDSMGNTVTVNGQDDRVTVESKESKVAIDGKGKKIILENSDNKVVVDGGGSKILLEGKNGVEIKTDGQLVIDAKRGVSNKGVTVDMDS